MMLFEELVMIGRQRIQSLKLYFYIGSLLEGTLCSEHNQGGRDAVPGTEVKVYQRTLPYFLLYEALD